MEALEARKAAIISGAKELKEAMESGQYALRVADSVMEALKKAQMLSIKDTMPSHYSRSRTIASSIRDDEIDHEKRNTLIRLDNSIQTLGRYLQDFAAELKDVTAMPLDDLPTTRFGNGLLFFDRWTDGFISELMVDSKLDKIRDKMLPLLNKLTPIVKRLEQEYTEKEAACAEIDERIRAIVLESR